MEIGDWRATRDLNDLYREIRDLGLEARLAELEAFGFTVVENALPPELTVRLRDAVLAEAEKRLQRSFDSENERDLEGWGRCTSVGRTSSRRRTTRTTRRRSCSNATAKSRASPR
jgi:hypothetical protein